MSTVKADYLVNAAGTGAPTLTNGAVLPAGSAAAPAISPTGDSNTGVFFPAADTIAFTEGGAEAMRIDSAGNVGVGTTSPSAQVHVYRNTTDGSAASLKLENAGATSSYATLDATAGTVQTFLYSDAAGNALGVAGATLRTVSNHPLLFGTNNTERMRIDASGNVGIGQTPNASQGKLQISQPLGSTVDGAMRLTDNATTSFVFNNVSSGLSAIWSSGALAFGTNSSTFTERMRIDASGNVGIGNTSPTSKLDVSGTIKDNLGPVRAAPIQGKTGAYAVLAADAGTTIYITTGGVTFNVSTLAAGDMVTIVNNSASNQTITAAASVTFRLAGTATTGNRTLAQYGMATFLCVVGGATPTFHCSGAGLT